MAEGKSSRKKGVALLIVGMVLGAALITPAGAHVGGTVRHLWTQHIKPKVTSLVYTKTQSNARYPRKTKYTRLHFTGSTSDATVGFAYEQLRSIGSFTKSRGSSMVKLTWTGHVNAPGSPSFCEFQLRVDGKKDTGSTSTSHEGASGAAAVVYTDFSPVNVTGLFGGLATGSHTVSIWLRGSAASCGINNGSFGQDVHVEEFDRA